MPTACLFFSLSYFLYLFIALFLCDLLLRFLIYVLSLPTNGCIVTSLFEGDTGIGTEDFVSLGLQQLFLQRRWLTDVLMVVFNKIAVTWIIPFFPILYLQYHSIFSLVFLLHFHSHTSRSFHGCLKG